MALTLLAAGLYGQKILKRALGIAVGPSFATWWKTQAKRLRGDAQLFGCHTVHLQSTSVMHTTNLTSVCGPSSETSDMLPGGALLENETLSGSAVLQERKGRTEKEL